jgi:hypothetical protein
MLKIIKKLYLDFELSLIISMIIIIIIGSTGD